MELDDIARQYLSEEKANMEKQRPVGEAMILEWRGDFYIGSVQVIAPKYDPEIVLLSKTSDPITKEFRNAILRLQPERKRLKGKNKLDLVGRCHIARRVGGKIVKMTPEQTQYMGSHPSVIRDLNTGEISFGTLVLYGKNNEEITPRNN